MNNKKGFTLTELLCVIVILGVIATLATSSVISVSNKSNENLYCAKLSLIKSEAASYGKIYEKELNQSTDYFEGNKSLTITVQDLVDAGKIDTDKNGMVINPVNSKSINDAKIILYLKNNKINAYMEEFNIC